VTRPSRLTLLVILALALLMFGPKKLPDLGKGLGEGIRGFKAALKSGDPDSGQALNEIKES